MATCFLVLGCARSGTSVTAGLLHRMGVVMGWELESEDGNPRYDWPDPIEMNPTGFYQDAPIEEALYDIWGNDYPEPGTRAKPEQLGLFRKLVQMRAARGHAAWGIKASHMPWVIEEFLEVCPDEVRFVFTDRSHDESARSIKKWFDDSTLEECEEWVRKANGQIASVKNDPRWSRIPRYTNTFADLYEKTEDTVSDLAAFVGVHVSQEAVAFVDPSLRRIQ